MDGDGCAAHGRVFHNRGTENHMLAQRRIALVLLAALVAAPLASCSSRGADTGATDEPKQTQEASGQEADKPEAEAQTQIANPFVDCSSAYEASKVAGFGVTFPESVPGFNERAYQAVKGELIQCIYSNGDERVLVRKGKGASDISGDYNEYSQKKDVTVGNLDLTEKGEGDRVYVVTWMRDGYSFAIDADNGLDRDVAEKLASGTL